MRKILVEYVDGQANREVTCTHIDTIVIENVAYMVCLLNGRVVAKFSLPHFLRCSVK